jgi:hypothetical protein
MPIGGYSYQPTAPMPSGTPGMAQGSPQEAVRLLNLRLPKNAPNAPVPSQLLTAQGGSGLGSLQALIQALMRAAGGRGTREMISEAPVEAITTGGGGTRGFDFMPRITIAEGGERQRIGDSLPGGTAGPGPMEDTPLFDAGIPRVRRQGGGAQPLF